MSSPALVATVLASDMDSLVERRDAAVQADLVELRLDGVAGADAREALADRTRPAIVTCRAAWEGGRFDGTEEERERILTDALDAGAEFVDVEWRASFRDRVLARDPARVIVSRHWFDAVPRDLADVAREMRGCGAAVVKLVVPASRLADTLPLLSLGRLAGPHERLALVAMGPAGVVTRILAARVGSCWTYAGDVASVGQLELSRLEGEFRFRALTRHTRVFGVVGRSTGHAPVMPLHNAAFEAEGLDAVCVPFDAQDLNDFMSVAQAFDVEGVVVEAPFAREAWARASALDPDARRTQVVTSLKREDVGLWSGRNTTVSALLAALGATGLAGKRAAILGGGNAARAAACALGSRGARVTVHARREALARRVAELVDGGVGAWPPPAGSWDVLVNATPVGAWPDVDVSPVEAATGELVCDAVCAPPETKLVRDARARGVRVVDGATLLVAQAAADFAWWTDLEAPAAAMGTAAARTLGSVLPGGLVGGGPETQP